MVQSTCMHRIFSCVVVGVWLGAGFWVRAATASPANAEGSEGPGSGVSTERRYVHGLPEDPGYFPIGVWLQDPRNAVRYKAAGINLYVGLWRGPTAEQLRALREAGMPVICAQTPSALEAADRGMIVGWMHDDEPDNAQALPGGGGYGPPILPEVIRADYERMRRADPTRPVLLNLGQGVAWDDYIGRGVRRRHPEDYPRYVEGADIVSFDIYPVVHESPVVAGRLEFVARGVERLVGWAGGRPVWNCVECTRIGNPDRKATPAQVRAEVWMALIRGSRGLIYFVHQFKPVFREAALLDDAEMLEAVTALNRQIRDLAPVLNSPSVVEGVRVTVADEVPIAWMRKRHEGGEYLFAANLSDRRARVSVEWTGGNTRREGTVEVLGEGRSVALVGSSLEDEFGAYGVHLYRQGR